MLHKWKGCDISMIFEKNRYFEYINENYIKPAPLTIIKDDVQISYPSDNLYEELGYKRKIADNMPEADETHYIERYYEDTKDAIFEHYRLVEVTEDEI